MPPRLSLVPGDLPLLVVADDHPASRSLVRHQLGDVACQVEEAESGGAALHAVRHLRPAVLLLDLALGDVHGHDVLARLAREGHLADTRVIVTSARAAGELWAALDAGAHDVLRKPYDAEELRARVRVALREAAVARARPAGPVAAGHVDTLTGLASRPRVEEHLAMAESLARRQRQPLAVALFDVDHLRIVNNDHGHAAGDEVLREVGRRVQASLRTEDLAGRWAGDEVLVVLPGTDLDGAWTLADRICRAVASAPVGVPRGAGCAVTVSAGCAAGPDGWEHLVRRAETAADQARSTGRNRAVAHPGL